MTAMNEIASFFLSVAGAVIVVLLGAIAFFLKKWIDSTDSLTESVNDLKTTVALLQTDQNNNNKTCSYKHNIIDKRLDEHSEKLSEHGEAIAGIQRQIDEKRKNIRRNERDN